MNKKKKENPNLKYERNGRSECDNKKNAVQKVSGEERDDRIAELEEQLLEKTNKERIMRNEIQELKGSIRVIARIRPFLPEEKTCDTSCMIVSQDRKSLAI